MNRSTLKSVVATLTACTLIFVSGCGQSQDSAADKLADKPGTTSGSGSGSGTGSKPAQPAQPKTITIPTGTAFTVAMDHPLNTQTNTEGEQFHARTSEAIRVNNVTVIPSGTPVHGTLTNVQEPGRTKGLAKMTLDFQGLTDQSGKSRAFDAAPILLEGAARAMSDEETVAAGAVIGGVIGAISSKKKAQGAAVGAAAGAAAGGVIALATKGKQIDLPSGQRFEVELTSPLDVTVPAQISGR